MSTHNTDATIVIEIFNDSMEASVAKNKLQEEGIETFLVDENAVGLRRQACNG